MGILQRKYWQKKLRGNFAHPTSNLALKMALETPPLNALHHPLCMHKFVLPGSLFELPLQSATDSGSVSPSFCEFFLLLELRNDILNLQIELHPRGYCAASLWLSLLLYKLPSGTGNSSSKDR